MKKIKWQRLLVFICLTLVISTVSGLFIGFYQANAAVDRVHITFGNATTVATNWNNYLSAYNDISKNKEGTGSTQFIAKSDGNGSFDPQIRLYKKNMGYTWKAGDVLQLYFRIDSKTDMTTNPQFKIYVGNTTADFAGEKNIIVVKADEINWNLVGETNDTLQCVQVKIPSTLTVSTINVIRIDIPDAGAYTQCAFRLWDLYMGPSAGGPIKTVSYKYKTKDNAWYTRTELVYKGNKPKNIPTPLPTAVNGTTAYDATEKWLNSSGTVVDVANTAVNADVTYTAQYTTQYQVTFKYRNATNDAWDTKSVWINSGSTPGNQVPTPTTYPQKTGVTHTRERYLDKWNGTATATVKTTKITAPVTYTADYVTQWQIQYSNYRESYDGGQVTTEEWVDNGQKPTKYKGKATYVRNSAGDTQYIIVKMYIL